MQRILDWLPLIVLLAIFFAAKARAWVMRRRGQRVIIVDWNRPLSEMIYDTLVIAVALCWICLLVAEAWPFTLAWLPAWLTRSLIDYLPVRLLGAALLPANMVGIVKAYIRQGAPNN